MGKKAKGNGEGTIYKSSKTGLYVGQYTINYKRHSVYQRKNEKISDFKKRFNNILSSINQGTYIEKSNETIMTLAKEYIENKHEEGVTSDRTYARDLGTLAQIRKVCSSFCNLPIQKVTIQHIEKAKIAMKQYSNSVISMIWRLLTKCFNMACSPSRRLIIYNLMTDETLKKPISDKKTKKVTALSNSEYMKLIDILDNEERNHKYRNVVKMQLVSGMRIGEVLARSFDDYDENTQLFLVHNTLTQDTKYKYVLGNHTKTYNKKTQTDEGKRYLPLNNELFNEILEIIKEQSQQKTKNIHNLLFWDYSKNTFVTPSEINLWLRRLNQKYKITKENLTTHRLRHTAITHWKEIGMDLSAIQYLAGHVEGSNITTDVYIDTSLDFVKHEIEKTI